MTNPFAPYPMPKLTCELVPSTSWGENLRSLLSAAKWKELRTACYVRAGHKCEVCNGVGRKHPVECHEIWHYDDGAHKQTLTGLIALCPDCHKVKHIGFALATGRYKPAIKHLAKVNGWSEEAAAHYALGAFQQHELRNRYQWVVDTSWLDNAESYIKNATKDRKAEQSQALRAHLNSKRSTDTQT